MKEYGAQVIIEKVFKSEEAAQNWMNRLQNKYEPTADNVETHLWVGNADVHIQPKTSSPTPRNKDICTCPIKMDSDPKFHTPGCPVREQAKKE